MNEKSDFDKLNDEIFILQQKLYEKESIIVNLKKETEKFPNSEIGLTKELYITDPTKINVELNNELTYTRDIMSKVSKMLNIEKIKYEKLDKNCKKISEDFQLYKNIHTKKNTYMENNYINSNNVITSNNFNLNSKSSKTSNNKNVQMDSSSNLNYSGNNLNKFRCK